MTTITHQGGCHCGGVRFEFDASADVEAVLCNCSICSRVAYRHWFVSKQHFRLKSDWSAISTYTFGSGVAQHYFCRTCGVKSFYVPRSHPDGYSVNVNCVDPATIRQLVEVPFDGRNWEKNVAELSPLSD